MHAAYRACMQEAEQSPVQLVREVQQLLPLTRHQLCHGDAGPAGNDLLRYRCSTFAVHARYIGVRCASTPRCRARGKHAVQREMTCYSAFHADGSVHLRCGAEQQVTGRTCTAAQSSGWEGRAAVTRVGTHAKGASAQNMHQMCHGSKM